MASVQEEVEASKKEVVENGHEADLEDVTEEDNKDPAKKKKKKKKKKKAGQNAKCTLLFVNLRKIYLQRKF